MGDAASKRLNMEKEEGENSTIEQPKPTGSVSLGDKPKMDQSPGDNSMKAEDKREADAEPGVNITSEPAAANSPANKKTEESLQPAAQEGAAGEKGESAFEGEGKDARPNLEGSKDGKEVLANAVEKSKGGGGTAGPLADVPGNQETRNSQKETCNQDALKETQPSEKEGADAEKVSTAEEGGKESTAREAAVTKEVDEHAAEQSAEAKQGETPAEAEGKTAPDEAFPNAPGSGGYLSRSHPWFKRPKSLSQSTGEENASPHSITSNAAPPVSGDLLLNLVRGLVPIRGAGLASTEGGAKPASSEAPGQSEEPTWRQQMQALQKDSKEEGSKGLETVPIVRKSEGLSQDLNLTWVAVGAESDQATEEVTKNLEAQLAVLQKVAATRFGEKTTGEEPAAGNSEPQDKETHAETMRKLKEELASLEQRAAAHNLLKPGGQSGDKLRGGFAELRMAGTQGLDAESAAKVVASQAEAREEVIRERTARGGTRLRKRRRPNGSYNCQVEGCEENLENAKAYNKRHHVCWVHSRAWEVLIGGVLSRFCQQCSRFHDVRAFDEIKRSCRERLLHHNKRRRTVSDSGDGAKGNGDASDREKDGKDSTPKVKRGRPPMQDTPPKPAPLEPDPLARALDTLMKAREQLGGNHRIDLARPPPERLPFESSTRGPGPPPGTYTGRLESSPLRPGPNQLPNPGVSTTPTRHDSTELTLARRSSGFELLDQVTGRGGAGLGTLPLGGSPGQGYQSPGNSFQVLGREQYPSGEASRQLGSVPTGFERLLQMAPRVESAAEAVDRSHSPFLDILMRNQHGLQESPQKGLNLSQHRLTQALQTVERAQIATGERPRDLTSDVAIRSPLLAAYVSGYDGSRVQRPSNNGASNSAIRSPTYNMLTDFIGGGQRGGNPLPLTFGDAGNQGFLEAGARDHSSAHASSLLRLMSSHVENAATNREPGNYLGASDGPLGLYGLTGQGQAQPPREQQGSWAAVDEQREQTAALHREFTRLIQSQTRPADQPGQNGGLGSLQGPFAGLSAQLGFQSQEPSLGSRSYKVNDWSFH